MERLAKSIVDEVRLKDAEIMEVEYYQGISWQGVCFRVLESHIHWSLFGYAFLTVTELGCQSR
jgi:hypothetical protein